MVKNKKEVKKETARVKIKWNVPDDMISRYASNVIVQVLENEFKLSFFETKPDIIFESKNPIPKEVRADCVASIIVSPLKIPAIIQVLQKQFNMFLAKQSKDLPQEQVKELPKDLPKEKAS